MKIYLASRNKEMIENNRLHNIRVFNGQCTLEIAKKSSENVDDHASPHLVFCTRASLGSRKNIAHQLHKYFQLSWHEDV